MRRQALFLFVCYALLVVVPDSDAAVGRTPTSFDVSHDGEATYSIPLYTPRGRGGMTPRLALTYGHRSENTLVGSGWSIEGLSLITRCGWTWAQDGATRDVRNDWLDKFCLDGNRLRLVAGAYGGDGAEYRTEIDATARIRSYGVAGNGPAYFVVERKDGLKYEYGTTVNSRIESAGQSTARAWAVARITDEAGNGIDVAYQEDTGNGSFRVDTIAYSNNLEQALSANPYLVDFFYEDKPPTEIDTAYFAGSLVKQVKRLDKVEIWDHSAAPVLVRSYNLEYQFSNTLKSRLISVQECAGADCMPATTFAYQDGTHGWASEVSTGDSVPATLGPMDVNGDGRDDLVYVSSTGVGGTWMVMFANASGGYDDPTPTGHPNTGFGGAIPIDYNADGLEDVLVPISGIWHVMLGSASSLAAPVTTDAPALGTGTGTNAAAIDINGDGRQDMVWADLYGWDGGDVIRYRLREPFPGKFSATATNLITPYGANHMISPGVFLPLGKKHPKRLPDFDGDGRGDVIYKHTQRIPNEGTGQWMLFVSLRVVCQGGQTFSGGAGPISAHYFGDFNADGKTDLLYYTGTQAGAPPPGFRLRFSTGTGFTGEFMGAGIEEYGAQYIVLDWDNDGYDDLLAPHMLSTTWHVMRSTGEGLQAPQDTGVPWPELTGPMLVADVNGDGLDDVIYGSGSVWHYRLHAGVQPDLLTTATDGYLNTATFAYAPLTSAGYTKGTTATFPDQDYQGSIHVVNSAAASNGIGGTYTTTFHYDSALVNLQGRGFGGFNYRRKHDSRNQLYTYDLFRRNFPFIGRLWRTEVRQSNDTTVVSEFVQNWNAQNHSSLDGQRKFVYLQGSLVMEHAFGGPFDGNWTRRVSTMHTVDAATGTTIFSETKTLESAIGNGVQELTQHTRTVQHPTLFTHIDADDWCIGRPALSRVVQKHTRPTGTEIVREVSTTWDGERCRPTQSKLQPTHPTLQVTVDIGYDAFGNVTSEAVTGKTDAGVDMPTRTTSVDWGSRRTFPHTITRPVSPTFSETTTLAWDHALGVQSGETDPNGVSVIRLHDAFGRLTQENRPNGTDTVWSYDDCATHGCVSGNNKVIVIETLRNASDGLITDVRTYLDRFDRPIVESRRQVTGAYDRQDTIYDALGRVAQQSALCWWASCTYFWTTFTYDALNRLTHESRPVSESDPTAQTTTLHYEGLTTRRVDALGKESRVVVNAMGWPARSAHHLGTHHQSFEHDGFGNLVEVTDSLGTTLQTSGYNTLGMRTSAFDIDRGDSISVFNSLGETLSHTDEKGQTTAFAYDFQGRMTSRVMPEGGGSISRTFTYGQNAAAKNVGKLDWMEVSGAGITTYRETYTYDPVAGRLAQTKYTENGTTNYFIDHAYNASTGFLEQITYPTSTEGFRFKIRYDYAYGLPQRVWNFDNNNQFWIVNAVDARGNATSETLGEATNGTTFDKVSTFDKVTGRLQARQSTFASGTPIENLGFLWDRVGNLTQRQDNRQGLTENFFYDDLHRLDYSTFGAQTTQYSYDERGNLTEKTGIGTAYSYTATVPGCAYYPHAQIHAVRQITGGGSTLNFCYDANGNMTNRNGTTLSWFADDMPKSIVQDASSASHFQYTPDDRRWRHVYRVGGSDFTSVYLGDLVEKVLRPDGSTSWKHFVLLDGEAIAVYIRTSTGAKDRYFFTKDHLGSPAAITHSDGAVTLRESFDAYGRRRGTAWTGVPTAGQLTSMNTITRRGFSFHEHLDSTGLIHMNGRAYDPNIGRFISADPFVPDALNTQSYNRYSYVENRPLSVTDPSGFTPCPECVPDTRPPTPGLCPSCSVRDWLIATRRPADWIVWRSRAPIGSGEEIPDVKSEEEVPPEPGFWDAKGRAWNFIGIGLFDCVFRPRVYTPCTFEEFRREFVNFADGPRISPKAVVRMADDALRVGRSMADDVSTGVANRMTTAAANRAASRTKGIPDSTLGPSGLPKRHTVEHSTRKQAREAAQREVPPGGRVRHDANPTDRRQGPHFQAEDAAGNNVKPVIHHEHPG